MEDHSVLSDTLTADRLNVTRAIHSLAPEGTDWDPVKVASDIFAKVRMEQGYPTNKPYVLRALHRLIERRLDEEQRNQEHKSVSELLSQLSALAGVVSEKDEQIRQLKLERQKLAQRVEMFETYVAAVVVAGIKLDK